MTLSSDFGHFGVSNFECQKSGKNTILCKYHYESHLIFAFTFPGAGEGVYKHFFDRDVSPKAKNREATENSWL